MSETQQEAAGTMAKALGALSEADKLRVAAWHLAELGKNFRDLRARLALLNCSAYLATRAQELSKDRVQ